MRLAETSKLEVGHCMPAVLRCRLNHPLVIDLDDALLKTDLLTETASRFLTQQPWNFFKLILWLTKERPVLMDRLMRSATLDVESLPYNQALLAWLHAEKAAGRYLVLVTVNYHSLAGKVAEQLGIFDDVLATADARNLKQNNKRDALVARFSENGFDYVGSNWADVPIWRSSAKAHVVSRSRRLIDTARSHNNLDRVFGDEKPNTAVALLKAMRPHQWIKNLLIFIPLLTAHQYTASLSLANSFLAFIVFGLTASSVYLLNDIVDVADDRHHHTKRHRPFAAGNLDLLHGWIAWPLMLIIAFTLAGPLGGLHLGFIGILAAYFFLTTAYSVRLKQIPMVDVLTLALLYTLRIIAGALAIDAKLSFWLLSFSMFFFLSLALIKRYSELRAARDAGKEGVLRGRGYDLQDLELVSSLGGSAGYVAVLVLSLYIQDSRTASMYSSPMLIWPACPLLLYWISRMWLIAHRGDMHADPIVFAIKDRSSWLVGLLLLTAFILARVVV